MSAGCCCAFRICLPAQITSSVRFFFFNFTPPFFSGDSFTNHSEVGSICLVQSSLPVLSMCCKKEKGILSKSDGENLFSRLSNEIDTEEIDTGYAWCTM